jgi:hypothetical protein
MRASKRVRGHARFVDAGDRAPPPEREHEGGPQRASDVRVLDGEDGEDGEDMEGLEFGAAGPQATSVRLGGESVGMTADEIAAIRTVPRVPDLSTLSAEQNKLLKQQETEQSIENQIRWHAQQRAMEAVHRPWDTGFPQPHTKEFDIVWDDINKTEEREDEMLADPVWRFMQSVAGLANTPLDHLGVYRHDTRGGLSEIAGFGDTQSALPEPAYETGDRGVNTLVNRLVSFVRAKHGKHARDCTETEGIHEPCDSVWVHLHAKPTGRLLKKRWADYMVWWRVYQRINFAMNWLIMNRIETEINPTDPPSAPDLALMKTLCDNTNDKLNIAFYFGAGRLDYSNIWAFNDGTFPSLDPADATVFTFDKFLSNIKTPTDAKINARWQAVKEYTELPWWNFWQGPFDAVNTMPMLQSYILYTLKQHRDLFLSDKVCKEIWDENKTVNAYAWIQRAREFVYKFNAKYVEIKKEFFAFSSKYDPTKPVAKWMESDTTYDMYEERIHVSPDPETPMLASTKASSHGLDFYTIRVDDTNWEIFKNVIVNTVADVKTWWRENVVGQSYSDTAITNQSNYTRFYDESRQFWKYHGKGTRMAVEYDKSVLYLWDKDKLRHWVVDWDSDDYFTALRTIPTYVEERTARGKLGIGFYGNMYMTPLVTGCLSKPVGHTQPCENDPLCPALKIAPLAQTWDHHNVHYMWLPYQPELREKSVDKDESKQSFVEHRINWFNIKHVLLAAFAGHFSSHKPLFGVEIRRNMRAEPEKVGAMCMHVDDVTLKYKQDEVCSLEYPQGAMAPKLRKEANTCQCGRCGVSNERNSCYLELDNMLRSFSSSGFAARWYAATVSIGNRPHIARAFPTLAQFEAFTNGNSTGFNNPVQFAQYMNGPVIDPRGTRTGPYDPKTMEAYASARREWVENMQGRYRMELTADMQRYHAEANNLRLQYGMGRVPPGQLPVVPNRGAAPADMLPGAGHSGLGTVAGMVAGAGAAAFGTNPAMGALIAKGVPFLVDAFRSNAASTGGTTHNTLTKAEPFSGELTKERMVSTSLAALHGFDRARAQVSGWIDVSGMAYGKGPHFAAQRRMDVPVPPLSDPESVHIMYNESPITPFCQTIELEDASGKVAWGGLEREGLETQKAHITKWMEQLGDDLYTWLSSYGESAHALAEMERALENERRMLMARRSEQLRGSARARQRVVFEPLFTGALDSAMASARDANAAVFKDVTLERIVASGDDITTLFARLVANFINQARHQGPRSYMPMGLRSSYGTNLRALNMALRRAQRKGATYVLTPPSRPSFGATYI